MKQYKVAVIGCGRGGEGVGGHSIGYAHGMDWKASPRARLVGACDLNAENLKKFCEHFDVGCGSENAGEMLQKSHPDVVSLCTYAAARPVLLEACVRADVKGIWCEKPFALSMNAARSMVELCDRHGVKMIVNHCRRPMPVFQKVAELLRAGKIGEPMLLAGSLQDWDQMEWGTHWHDMFRFWAGDQPVQWVMGQARCSGKRRGYGHVIEEHTVGYYSFADGTRALLDGGVGFRGKNALSLFGTEGVIHLTHEGKVTLINRNGLAEFNDLGGIHPGPYGGAGSLKIPHALLDWMEGGPEPDISAANALKSTELYLSVYESARRGDRIDLPLPDQDEFPLDAVAARQDSK